MKRKKVWTWDCYGLVLRDSCLLLLSTRDPQSLGTLPWGEAQGHSGVASHSAEGVLSFMLFFVSPPPLRVAFLTSRSFGHSFPTPSISSHSACPPPRSYFFRVRLPSGSSK